MRLVENLARRQHQAIIPLHDIGGMSQRGFGPEEIAGKTGPTLEYVPAVMWLLEKGEHRLLRAVESSLSGHKAHAAYTASSPLGRLGASGTCCRWC